MVGLILRLRWKVAKLGLVLILGMAIAKSCALTP